MVGLEAMLAALGPAVDSFFETENRRPSLLLPPAMSSDARADLVRSETATLEALLPKVGKYALI